MMRIIEPKPLSLRHENMQKVFLSHPIELQQSHQFPSTVATCGNAIDYHLEASNVNVPSAQCLHLIWCLQSEVLSKESC